MEKGKGGKELAEFYILLLGILPTVRGMGIGNLTIGPDISHKNQDLSSETRFLPQLLTLVQDFS